ncbi:DNA-binding protein [Aquaspirillum serpens]|uniref:DNA-binding protein n=1 Tax=Aquaspirillum serpens TaxID=190 RepID=UPI0003B77F08|nr:DNA-binding protein [Aquaspirillum serpens]
MEYEFTLKFKIPSDPVDELIEKLAEAGCDDALIGIGTPGKIALEFIRESTSAKQAIISAIRDVKSAIPDAMLIEVGSELVW